MTRSLQSLTHRPPVRPSARPPPPLAFRFRPPYLEGTPLRSRPIDLEQRHQAEVGHQYRILKVRSGELYEAKGDRAKAADRYRRFVNLWKDAGTELQPGVREVRARLARLSTESSS